MTRENEKLVYELEEVLAALSTLCEDIEHKVKAISSLVEENKSYFPPDTDTRQMEETILKELARYQEYALASRESQSLADDEPSPNRSTARGR